MRSRQRGVAIITVLLVVAIASALAFSLGTQQMMVIGQSRQVLVGDQLRNLLLGGEVLARQVLHADWEDEETRGKDTLLESWAQATPPFEVPGGFIEIQIRDLQNCFNLNGVALGKPDKEALAHVARVFEMAGLDPQLADTWVDWIDPDEDVTNFGAEDSEYLGRTLSYRTANQLAGHISEVRLLAEIDAEQYAALSAAACVLPEALEAINVNTVTAQTLAVLQADFSEEQALSLIESERDYDSKEKFIEDNRSMAEIVGMLSVTSSYFEVSVRAELDGERAEMVSTLYRDAGNGAISLVGRDYGRRFITRLQVEVEEG